MRRAAHAALAPGATHAPALAATPAAPTALPAAATALAAKIALAAVPAATAAAPGAVRRNRLQRWCASRSTARRIP